MVSWCGGGVVVVRWWSGIAVVWGPGVGCVELCRCGGAGE